MNAKTTKKGAMIERVKKLLRLARSSEKHEAESARATADALMREHGLALEDIYDEDDDPVIVDTLDHERPVPWRKNLAIIVAISRGCVVGVNARGGLFIRGVRDALVDARSTYELLVRRLVERQGNSYSAIEVVAREMHAFGFVRAVAERLAGSAPPPPPPPAAAPVGASVPTPLDAKGAAPEHTPADQWELACAKEAYDDGYQYGLRVHFTAKWVPKKRVRRVPVAGFLPAAG